MGVRHLRGTPAHVTPQMPRAPPGCTRCCPSDGFVVGHYIELSDRWCMVTTLQQRTDNSRAAMTDTARCTAVPSPPSAALLGHATGCAVACTMQHQQSAALTLYIQY